MASRRLLVPGIDSRVSGHLCGSRVERGMGYLRIYMMCWLLLLQTRHEVPLTRQRVCCVTLSIYFETLIKTEAMPRQVKHLYFLAYRQV